MTLCKTALYAGQMCDPYARSVAFEVGSASSINLATNNTSWEQGHAATEIIWSEISVNSYHKEISTKFYCMWRNSWVLYKWNVSNAIESLSVLQKREGHQRTPLITWRAFLLSRDAHFAACFKWHLTCSSKALESTRPWFECQRYYV